ncbi:hypothetical protein T03_10264 [Trichinella britovi]|uniref:Uncharacterized protein n=1 Tax=Trichinella britovi TaxID=45882 RepID=A0A0V1CAH0_TRIBR|nr:hypothetical protein T03_10264 [Trichinella britovi]
MTARTNPLVDTGPSRLDVTSRWVDERAHPRKRLVTAGTTTHTVVSRPKSTSHLRNKLAYPALSILCLNNYPDDTGTSRKLYTIYIIIRNENQQSFHSVPCRIGATRTITPHLSHTALCETENLECDV